MTEPNMKPVLLSKANDEDTEMVEIFEIDGRGYSIPSRAKVNEVLRYLRTLRKENEDVANAELLERMLGEDAYEALMEFEGLTQENLKEIMAIVQHVVMGPAETAGKK